MNLNKYKTLEQLAEAMNTLIGGGGSSSPTIAYYMTNAGQSISDTTLTIVDFEDQKHDTGSLVTTGASWKFTASTAGYYGVKAGIQFAASLSWAKAEYGRLSVYKDGTLYCHLDYRDELISGGTAVTMPLHGMTVVYLAASSYIDVRVYHNAGSAIALESSTDPQEYNYIAIWSL